MTATVFRGLDGTVKRLPAEKPEADGPFDVVIKITHSGLCASDHAYVPYGIALGHEGVGIVVAIGSAVTRFQIGDRAGGGYLRKACGDCALCLDGKEIWCHNRVIFGEADYGNGTIADYYKSNEKFLYKIPENLSSEDAAPLQCAGATVYSALTETVKPGNRVGIMGIGGLGHLAIQFAAKMGAEVVVFSTTPNKESEARSFGASEFVLSSEPEAISSPVDVLIVAGGSPDWPKFLKKEVITRSGLIVPLSVSATELELPFLALFFGGYKIHTSLVASRGRHVEMLNFAAKHQVKPVVERFPLSQNGYDAASAKLKNGTMRYRGVLVAEQE